VQASQVLLFSDNPEFSRPILGPGDGDARNVYVDIFVQNYSRLPVPSTRFVAELSATENGAIEAGDESRVLVYNLGPLAPCKQFRVDEFVNDATTRGWEYYVLFSVWFFDVAVEQWVGELGHPVRPYEESRLFESEYAVVHDLGAVAEPIPNCSPG
jgi:hypothetical protein